MKKEKKESLKPFVKWVGGKRQILDKLLELVPEKYNTYYEPFLGGGALFFAIEPERYVVSDINKNLINVYKCIENNYKFLIKLLKEHEEKHNEEYYYKIRNEYNNEEIINNLDFNNAAKFIYLNKAGFNGLYRTNKKGEFNVPFGKKKEVNLYDKDNLKNIHEFLSKSLVNKIVVSNFQIVKQAEKDDFIYLDPPYDKINETSFTSYNDNNFDRIEQLRLFKLFEELTKKGVKVMLSNHSTEFIKDLYKDYKIIEIEAKRMVNSDATKRNGCKEVIILNY